MNFLNFDSILTYKLSIASFEMLIGILLIILIVLLLYAYKRLSKNIQKGVLSIKKDITDSIEPKFIDLSPETRKVIDLATEAWRLEKNFSKSDIANDKAIAHSISKLKRFLQEHKVEIKDYTGKKYDPGLNVEVISSEYDESASETTIKETFRPAIMVENKLVQRGQVIIANNQQGNK